MTRHSKKAALAAVTGVGIAGLLGACSSDSKSSTTTTTAKAASSSAGTTATTKAATNALPAAPSGSVELQNTTTNGVVYQRWSNAGATPQQIVTDYQNALTAEGYTITNSGGGGGGWGKWGGANAGLSANKSGVYVDVQAGGQSGQTTYFEVCQGTNKSAVDQCENASQGPDTNSGGS
jgi:hypothetical protein